MTNYERLKSMSIEEMARQNIKPVMVNIGYQLHTIFITSDGYQSEDKYEAFEQELEWLKSEVE